MDSDCCAVQAEYRQNVISNMLERTHCGEIFTKGPAITKKFIGRVSQAEMINQKKRYCGYEIKSRTIWVLSGLLVLFLCSTAMTITLWFTTMFDEAVKSQLALVNGTKAYESWINPPVQSRFGVHIFNYTNVEDFESKKTSKLKVDDVGPYTYVQTLERINPVYNGDGTVSYQEKKTYKFLPEASPGLSEEDFLSVPNMPMLGTVSMYKDASLMVKFAFAGLFKGLNSNPFLKVPANRFIWGYDDGYFALVKGLMAFQKPIPFEKFGILASRATSTNIITISTGEHDIETIQRIKKFDGKDKMEHYKDECSRIDGTDGSGFSPKTVRNKEPISIYHRDICRKLPMQFSNVTKILGDSVTAHRYVIPKTIFATPDIEPENHCYCPKQNCPISGVFDVSPCNLAPVFISLPHFLHGDPSLSKAIDGLKPDEAKHSSFLDVHPTLGYAMAGHSRFQININAQRVFGIHQTNVFDDDLMLPVAWFDVGVDDVHLPDSLTEVIYTTSVTIPRVELALRYGSLLMSLITLIVMGMLIYGCRNVKRSRRHILQRNQSGMDSLIP